MLKNIKDNIPNIITASRGFIFLPLVIINSIMGNVPLALAFFAAGAFTDTIDGALARKLKVVTKKGAKLDAGVDVFFAAGTLISAAALNPVMLAPIAFEIAKLSVCGYVMLSNKEVTPVSRDGKIKQWLLGITTAIGFGTVINPLMMDMLIPAIALTSVLQVKTTIGYAKCLKKKESKALEIEKAENVELENDDETTLLTKKKTPKDKYLALKKEALAIQEFVYRELGIIPKGSLHKLEK